MADNHLSRLLDGIEKMVPSAAALERAVVVENVQVAEVLSALNSFNEIVRYLNTRRSKGAILQLEDEAAVQDALFLMLRPWIPDLVPENPTQKVANRFAIKDFISTSNRFVIEAKFVRNSDHGKNITKEINDDIETYRYHDGCDDLIFFVYDPESFIPDSQQVSKHIQSDRIYGSKKLRCHAIIKP